jgi:metal-dependent amidase/aminoacylase/carboxypeptidase family protein
MADVDDFDLVILGQSAHTADPQKGVDAIMLACTGTVRHPDDCYSTHSGHGDWRHYSGHYPRRQTA